MERTGETKVKTGETQVKTGEIQMRTEEAKAKASLGGTVYFERQRGLSMQCGLFSVNHLLGGRVYSQQAMTQICYSLSDDYINPHKHIFGGDYDLNVLILALQQQQLATRWHDARQPLSVPSNDQCPQLVGYLVNIYC